MDPWFLPLRFENTVHAKSPNSWSNTFLLQSVQVRGIVSTSMRNISENCRDNLVPLEKILGGTDFLDHLLPPMVNLQDIYCGISRIYTVDGSSFARQAHMLHDLRRAGNDDPGLGSYSNSSEHAGPYTRVSRMKVGGICIANANTLL